jgi:hypothetical protein
MARVLRTSRSINRECKRGEYQTVFCTAAGFSGLIRIIQAREVHKIVVVKTANGDWVRPHLVFSV